MEGHGHVHGQVPGQPVPGPGDGAGPSVEAVAALAHTPACLTGVPSTLSKRRYAELERTLRGSGIDGDSVTQMLRVLCDVLRFDPSASGYTPRRAASIRAYREKKKSASTAPAPAA